MKNKAEIIGALLIDLLLIWWQWDFVRVVLFVGWQIAQVYPVQSSVLVVILTWINFGFIMRMQQLRDAGKLEWRDHPIRRALVLLILPFALILDVASNVIYSFLCLELPQWHKFEFLLTARLCRHFGGNSEWRSIMAGWIGYEFLDDVDPSGVHVS